MRGRGLGVALAYAWLAFPLALYDDVFAFNDSLVAATLAATLLVAANPVRRGIAAALAAWSKLSPLALVPLLAGHRPAGTSRADGVRRFAGAFLLSTLVVFAPVLLTGAHGDIVQRTVRYQLDRGTNLSLWALAQQGVLGAGATVRHLADAAHGLLLAMTGALAIALFWAPRREDVVGLAGAAGAVMLGIAVTVSFFSFSYLVWLAPLVLAAALPSALESA